MQIFAVGEEAVGFIAIGQMATGFFALGQMATGVIAIGQLARGVVAIGQVAVGVYAVGMLSVGVNDSLGMLAIGGRARGLLPISIFPKLTPEHYELPLCTDAVRLLQSRQEGWLAVAGREEQGQIALFSGQYPLTLRFDSRVHGGLRRAIREAAGSMLCVHVAMVHGEAVIDEVIYAPSSDRARVNPVLLLIRFFFALALAVVFWIAVAQPIAAALFVG